MCGSSRAKLHGLTIGTQLSKILVDVVCEAACRGEGGKRVWVWVGVGWGGKRSCSLCVGAYTVLPTWMCGSSRASGEQQCAAVKANAEEKRTDSAWERWCSTSLS